MYNEFDITQDIFCISLFIVIWNFRRFKNKENENILV